jgi:uncharacterized protein
MPGASPMFPLQAVLFPGAPLHLHVFEPRYQGLLADCLAGDRSFGVVLITRGSEVGGGDVRAVTGTRALIEVVEHLPDGRALVVARGTERFAVSTWLDDDPYPRAEIDPLSDTPTASDREAIADAALVVREARAIYSELEPAAPVLAALPDLDAEALSFWLCEATPIGPYDRQRLLEARDVTARMQLLCDLAAEATAAMRALLSDRA